MKLNLLGLALGTVLGSTAFADNLKLTCMTGDIGDVSIELFKIDQEDEETVLWVEVTGGDGEGTVYKNSRLSKKDLKAIKRQGLTKVISKSDGDDVFGGAFLKAGLLNLKYNSATKEYSAVVAVDSVAIVATCTAQ